MRCQSCGHDNRPERRFCAECGAALATNCAACGVSNEPGEKFCGGCGAAVPVSSVRSQLPGPGTHHPTADTPDTQGERRQLTVLFCDLVGSTPLSQQLDAEEWRDIIAPYHQTAAGAVERFGGHVAKYLGDGVLVLFGYPHAHEDDAERAVRAGLALVEQIAGLRSPVSSPNTKYRTARNSQHPTSDALSVRIGIHTGLTVIADVGGKADVFGETPNIAGRVQSAAQPDTVLITAATQRLIAGMFVVEDHGPQVLKGVREPLTLYRVVRPSGVRSRLDVAAGALTRFVGRDMELGTLIDRWDRAAEGEGQAVLILGEAGVGKSRLAYQLRERLATVPHTWLECRSTPYTEGTPFFPVIELVQQGLAFAPADTAGDKLDKIERALAATGVELAEAVPLMADFLGVPHAEAHARLEISPELQRHKTMELLAKWYLALAEVQPLVLLMEDLHWSDPSSLELLSRITALSTTARVLVVTTARPEFTPLWPTRSNMTTLQLTRLTKRQAREMVQALCAGIGDRGSGTGPAPEPIALSTEVIGMLVTRADGVPLYLEELTKAVVEPGTAPTLETIPATLADSLMARLDRLSAAKEVAQRAAVLGREFPYSLLAAVAGLEAAALRQGLARLTEAGITFMRGTPPEATFTFKHALVQEAAYGSLLKRTRQQLHSRVVDVLVTQFPERAAAEPEVVARHAETAGRIDEAIIYLQRAGEHAQVRSAHGEAIVHFQRAIVLLAGQPAGHERDQREVALQLALGASLVAARGFAHMETATAYERARELADSAGEAAQTAPARIGLSIVYISRGDAERGRALAVEVLAEAEARSDVEDVISGHTQIAAAELYQGQFTSSLAHAERVLALYEPQRHRGLVRVLGTDQNVAALNYTACNLWALGRPDAALSRAEQAVELARRLDHPFSLGFALSFAAVIDWWRGDHAQQRARGAELVGLSEAQGFPLWLGAGRAWQGAAAVAAGKAASLADLVGGLALGGETGTQAAAPLFSGLLAQAQRIVGQLNDARGTVASGLALAIQTGQPFYNAELHRLDGEIVLAIGATPADAEPLFHRALDIAHAQEARSFELRAAISLARLWRDRDQRAAARDLLGPLYAWFTEGFDTGDLIEAKALLEELN